MITCTFCHTEKQDDQFYIQNGYRNPKCKECRKEYRKARYREDPEFHRSYDRMRYLRPERKKQIYDSLNRQHELHPEKYNARQKTKQAVKRKKIVRPDKCSMCGLSAAQIEAHHDDYKNYLHVAWVCTRCHRHVIHKDVYAVGV